MPFEKGRSGNPTGRPCGARNKTTVAIEKLLDADAKAITQKAIDLAKGGDLTAIRLCLERLCPPRKDRPVSFNLPALATPADALQAQIAIVRAVAVGDVTPSEALELSRVVESFARVSETADLADRIKRLEQMAGAQ